jgi:Xaa-Pro aminopeptidase
MDRLRDLLGGLGCGALVVTNLVNVRYLTGFSGSAGVLFVGDRETVLVTDGRYRAQAPAELARAGAAARVEAFPAVADQLALLAELVAGVAQVALEAEHVSWARQRQFRESWPDEVALVATGGLVEQLRKHKDAGELARVAAAARVADAAFTAVYPLLEEGTTEAELAASLDSEMRRLGAEAPAFDTIVASGPNGAEPHHRPSGRRAAPGELVVIDFGARVEGYCSDMTRTVRVGDGGELPPELARAASVVMVAQDAGLCAVQDGACAAEVDRACREVVDAAGFGELFVHGTGHGVGLDVHEPPYLASSSADILGSGQVVTVEPGVYIPGLGGVRTEDTVHVTEAGCEVLTLAPKELPDAGKRRRPPGPN